MRYLIVSALILLATPVHAEKVRIQWKGDYAHNSDDHYSPQNKYKSGLSKFFNNGSPEESGKIQKEGVLEAELLKPKGGAGAVQTRAAPGSYFAGLAAAGAPVAAVS